MLLALGAIALCSSAFSQLNVNQNINGNVVTGTIPNHYAWSNFGYGYCSNIYVYLWPYKWSNIDVCGCTHPFYQSGWSVK